MLEDNNKMAMIYEGMYLHQLFEQQAARYPEAIALAQGDVQLSYGELNQKANYLARTSDLVLPALEHARRLFPFPMLGIDTDNGAEFINDDLVAYCEHEQLTFTCGRPAVKNDQCYIEQKNGAVVRHFVGHDRLVGEQAYQQLGELYRALRLYVNCFQPCMKLLSKQQEEGNHVRRAYDEAKTPLQRLLLSGVLSTSAKRELEEVAQALDPLDLAAQVEQLQQAVWRHAVPTGSSASPLRFAVEQCLSEPQIVPKGKPDPAVLAHEDPQRHPPFLNWRRSSTNPFASEWEWILAWVRTHSDCSTRELFHELQQVFPGRYQPSQYPALQRGVRKMRAFLRESMVEDSWPVEVIHGPLETTGVTVPRMQEPLKGAECSSNSSIAEQEGTPHQKEPSRHTAIVRKHQVWNRIRHVRSPLLLPVRKKPSRWVFYPLTWRSRRF